MLNYERQSVEGISISMFVLAIIGNITYVLSILVRSLDYAYLYPTIPWLVRHSCIFLKFKLVMHCIQLKLDGFFSLLIVF